VKLEVATKECTGVIIARIDDLGTVSPGSPGATDFEASKWTIVETLRGKLAGHVRLDFTVQTSPASIREESPKAGATFIALLRTNPTLKQPGQILKLVRDTPDDRAVVKELLSK
jgi:hypothetical protein